MSKRPLVRNAADPEQVEAATQSADLARDQELADLRAILALPAGRRLLWRMLAHAGVFRQSFAGEETHVSAFAEGARSHGTWLIAELEAADPAALVSLMQERLDERQRELAARAAQAMDDERADA